jgi:hypothetical protein
LLGAERLGLRDKESRAEDNGDEQSFHFGPLLYELDDNAEQPGLSRTHAYDECS